MSNKSYTSPRARQDKSLCTRIHDYFKEYCDSTSIHGFRYFGEDRSLFERIWWVTIFILCLSGCSYMIYKIYEKYDTSPVMVAFSTKDTPIYEVPFPAVTICAENKASKLKFNYTKMVEKKLANQELTREENKYLQYMSIFCDVDDKNYQYEDKSTKDNVEEVINSELNNLTFNSNDFYNCLDELKPVFDEIPFILSCKFGGIPVDNCSDVFTPIITDEGICYSFNILDRSQIFSDLVSHYKDYHKATDKDADWSIEHGYSKGSGTQAFPTRAILPGVNNGLQVQLTAFDFDLDFICKSFQGFKVAVHPPFTVPRMKEEYFRVPLDQGVMAAVQPSMITTSEKVQAFDVEKRGCYFSTEIKLKYFNFYSQQNCQLECITNYTLRACKCVTVYMPRDNSTDICGSKSDKCVKEAEMGARYFRLFSDLDKTEEIEELEQIDIEICKCLPLCSDITYESQISQTEWDWERTFQAVNDFTVNKSVIHVSSLIVYFKYDHFIASERQELYGPTDFIANFGGLLGLFTGFSILSMMEIIYFLTVRICCNVRLYGRWSGPYQ